MSRYELFVGRRVEARYRAGYIYYSATGTLTVDNGTSIFIEDRSLEDGRNKTVRVEIPYECIIGVAELSEEQRPSV
ncbi:MAG TPA: hypothetical protein VNU84_01945 [Candidatus Acidoferrum sp.]|nr:hypothetical protein [Candidatus Acidoferrum sp.]